MRRFGLFILWNAIVALCTYNTGTAITVSGQVADSTGIPVADAQIIFTNEVDTSKTYTATTNVDGQYRALLDIASVISGIAESEIPIRFHLFPNYPNPFNPSTLIPYQLGERRRVRLVVYNILGQPIRTLVDEVNTAGLHQVEWDGRDNSGRGVGAGLYLIRIEMERFAQSRKMLLIDGAKGSGIGSTSSTAPKRTTSLQPRQILYTLTITGEDIVPFAQHNLAIRIDTTLNFEVARRSIHSVLEENPADSNSTNIAYEDLLVIERDFFRTSSEDNTDVLRKLKSYLGRPAIVKGNISIRGNESEHLDELENLVVVDGHFSISRFPNLKSLKGLNNLRKVTKGLDIRDNPELKTLEGLDNLSVGQLVIEENTKLKTFEELGNIAVGHLSVIANPALENLNGLNSIKSLDGLTIIRNPLLRDINGLTELATVRYGILIEDNDSLEDLNGLRSIRSVGENNRTWNTAIRIWENTLLKRIDGLSNIQNIGSGSIEIDRNINLSQEEVALFEQHIGFIGYEGDLKIGFNKIDGIPSNFLPVIVPSPFSIKSPGIVHDLLEFTNHGPFVIMFQPHRRTHAQNVYLSGVIDPRDADGINRGVNFQAIEGLEQLWGIVGELSIIGNVHLDLSGLSGLREVHSLRVDRSSQENLNGLDNLNVVHEHVTIKENDDLINLTGLNGLERVKGSMGIGIADRYEEDVWYLGNSSLKDLNGLDNLTFVDQKLWIVDNDALPNFTGLGKLSEIGDEFLITQNSSLINFSGLNSLRLIKGDWIIDQNESLENPAGAIQLEEIGGSLTITQNSSFINLNGLGNLKTIEGDWIIGQNESLESLVGVDQLEEISGSLIITNNPQLSSLDGLDNLHHIGGNLVIQDNKKITSLDGQFRSKALSKFAQILT